eukprot:6644609-Prymnesium_polylepis.1
MERADLDQGGGDTRPRSDRDGTQLLTRGIGPLRQTLQAVQGGVGGGARVRPHSCGAGCTISSQLSLKLLAELRHLYALRDRTSGVSAMPANAGDNLLEWRATIEGPEATPWEGRAV